MWTVVFLVHTGTSLPVVGTASVSDPDPVGSGSICGIRIRNTNFGSRSGKDPELDFDYKLNFLPNNNVHL